MHPDEEPAAPPLPSIPDDAERIEPNLLIQVLITDVQRLAAENAMLRARIETIKAERAAAES